MVVLLQQRPPLCAQFPFPSIPSSGQPRRVLLRSCRRTTPVAPSHLSMAMRPSAAAAASSSNSSVEDNGEAAVAGSQNLLAMDFPYLPSAHQELMSDLLSTLGDHLNHHLLPSSVPPDVRQFQNATGSSMGAINILLGSPGSPIDFILESWIHCQLPFGTLNITTLFAFLDASATDAPHLLMEFIQSGPNSLVLLMDLLPRKDVVLHPDYLDYFYHQTSLDKIRQEFDKSAAVAPYISTSLYIRSVLSPTAIAINIKSENWEGEGGMEEIIRSKIAGAARELTNIWLEKCVTSSHMVIGTDEQNVLQSRDALIKSKAIEIDLTANLPRLFGQDVADKVVAVIREAFGA